MAGPPPPVRPRPGSLIGRLTGLSVPDAQAAADEVLVAYRKSTHGQNGALPKTALHCLCDVMQTDGKSLADIAGKVAMAFVLLASFDAVRQALGLTRETLSVNGRLLIYPSERHHSIATSLYIRLVVRSGADNEATFTNKDVNCLDVMTYALCTAAVTGACHNCPLVELPPVVSASPTTHPWMPTP